MVTQGDGKEKVKSTSVPLLEPVKLADAPTLSLKDLVLGKDFGKTNTGLKARDKMRALSQIELSLW